MLAKQYLHRLPANYSMEQIRRRVSERAPLWDETPGLGFKAFLIQERSRHGAQQNAYSALYLWLQTEAALEFIVDQRFRSVIETFGRPRIETWLALDARRGRAARPLFAFREDLDIPVTADLATLRREEREKNAETAGRAEIFASVVAIDPTAWRLARFTLAEEGPRADETRRSFEIAHLAKPGLAAIG